MIQVSGLRHETPITSINKILYSDPDRLLYKLPVSLVTSKAKIRYLYVMEHVGVPGAHFTQTIFSQFKILQLN